MISGDDWQTWCGRALIAHIPNARVNATRNLRDHGVDLFDDNTIYLCYAPQTADRAVWAQKITSKLADDVGKLTNDDYRVALDALLRQACITRVILLVPDLADAAAANTAAALRTTHLRTGRGDRDWLDPSVTVLVRAKLDHFPPDIVRRIDGIAKDPPFAAMQPPGAALPEALPASASTPHGFLSSAVRKSWSKSPTCSAATSRCAGCSPMALGVPAKAGSPLRPAGGHKRMAGRPASSTAAASRASSPTPRTSGNQPADAGGDRLSS